MTAPAHTRWAAAGGTHLHYSGGVTKQFQSIAHDVVLGEGTTVHEFVNLYGCRIGAHSRIGAFVEIQRDVTIGDHCKISTHSFICSGVHIADRVFIGHGVTFVNDMWATALSDFAPVASRLRETA